MCLRTYSSLLRRSNHVFDCVYRKVRLVNEYCVLFLQMSFRGFNKLAETSPFKRQLSLRLNELPSTLERTGQLQQNNNINGANQPNGPGKGTAHSQSKHVGVLIGITLIVLVAY